MCKLSVLSLLLLVNFFFELSQMCPLARDFLGPFQIFSQSLIFVINHNFTSFFSALLTSDLVFEDVAVFMSQIWLQYKILFNRVCFLFIKSNDF